MRKVIVYIAASLDGFIAGPNDDLSFLKRVEREGEDYGYAAFSSAIDTVIMGRRTYEWVTREVGPAVYDEGSNDVYVITRTPQPTRGKTKFYQGDVEVLIQQLKAAPGKDIFCDGGAMLIDSMLKENLIDEMIISVIPVLLGNGTRLFKEGRPEHDMQLLESKAFESGLVQLHYQFGKS